MILKYELWYSETEDEEDFIPIQLLEDNLKSNVNTRAEGIIGSWEKNYDTKTAEFDSIKAKRIRLKARETVGGESMDYCCRVLHL